MSDLQVSRPKSQLSKPYMSDVWPIFVVLVSIGLSKSKLRREVGKIQSLIHLWHLIIPLIFPPRAPRSPPDRLPERAFGLLEAIKILIIFGHRFWVDFGSFWGAILGSFLALLEAKMCRVRSKTRLESVSTSKTRIFTK